MINPFIALQLLASMAEDRIAEFKANEKGATAVEYALIVGAVAAVIVTAMVAFKGKLTSLFDSIDVGSTTTPSK
ncbi:pilus assembly protein Flp/PilA [Blastococcus fimeti]|nr:pilus assembly protein Flp/PilA [Blastococcus fimeti]